MKKPKIKYIIKARDDNTLYLFFKFSYAGMKHKIHVVHYYGDAYYVAATIKDKYYYKKDKDCSKKDKKYFSKKYEKDSLYCFSFSAVQKFLEKHLGRDYTQYFPDEFFSTILIRKMKKNKFE